MKKGNSLKAKDHIKLSTEEYLVSNSKASVILVHGLGEYKARYHHIAEACNQEGFSFLIFDLRGHGDSQGKRGHTPSFDTLLDDLEVVIEYVAQDNNNNPIVLYGHSMGGNIVANYLIRKKERRIYAAIITSPWFRLRMKASSFKLAIGQLH